MERLIDADALAEEIRSMHIAIGGRDIFPQEEKACVLMHIETEPTVDAVTVVRCRDCKHFEKSGGSHCTLLNTEMGRHDFCSCAERRDAEC